MKNTCRVAIVGFIVLSKLGIPQEPKSSAKSDKESIPTATLNLADGKPLIGFPSAAVIGSPTVCSTSGDIFVEVYANVKMPMNVFPDLYRITSAGDVKRIDQPKPTDYEHLFLRSAFAGEHAIVSLIQVSGKKTSSVSDKPNIPGYFLSITDFDGGSAKLIELDLKFQPLRIAVLPSGKFIVLGLDSANLVPALVLLNDDGTFLKSVDLDNSKYDNSQELRNTYNANNSDTQLAKRKQISGVLNAASFAPYGSKVLLVEAGSTLPIRILGDGGEENTVSIPLPSGFLIQNVLGSNQSTTWIVRAQKLESYQKMEKEHIVMNPEQRLFEVNPETKKVARILDTKGAPPTMVSCAANAKLSAIYNDPPEGSSADVDRWVLATAPR